MVRPALLAACMLALAACAAHRTPTYVVRLDLERIAAHTAVKDHQPGFKTLGG